MKTANSTTTCKIRTMLASMSQRALYNLKRTGYHPATIPHNSLTKLGRMDRLATTHLRVI
jgi:hypothetical protein